MHEMKVSAGVYCDCKKCCRDREALRADEEALVPAMPVELAEAVENPDWTV